MGSGAYQHGKAQGSAYSSFGLQFAKRGSGSMRECSSAVQLAKRVRRPPFTCRCSGGRGRQQPAARLGLAALLNCFKVTREAHFTSFCERGVQFHPMQRL